MKKISLILTFLLALCAISNAQIYNFECDIIADEGYSITSLEGQGIGGLWYVENNGAPYLNIDMFVFDPSSFLENDYLCIEVYVKVEINGVFSNCQLISYYNGDPDATYHINGRYDLPVGTSVSDLDHIILDIENMSSEGLHCVYW